MDIILYLIGAMITGIVWMPVFRHATNEDDTVIILVTSMIVGGLWIITFPFVVLGIAYLVFKKGGII